MPHPPKYAHRFLRWFCKEDFLEEIEGDLIELFDLTSVDNSKKARRNFNWGVLTHFRPDYIKDFQPNIHLIHPAMIRHNFLITYRSFLRNKSSFLINLIGLSTGLAAFLLIHLWVKDELSVDKFHEKDRQIYKVKHNLEFAAGTSTWEETPLILGSSLLEEMPEVQQAVAVNNFFHWISKEGIISHNEKYLQVQGRHATEGFFEMFSYPLLMGKKENVLAEKQNIVISRNLAVSLFVSVEESIGKFVEWDNPSFEGTYKVSGVFENIPPYSTEQFDVVFTMGTLEDFVDDHNLKNFRGSYAHTYLQL
ncbi:MAG: permease prefix domain 2-containing transporter, partial [Bacteroidota bacterium]